MELLVAGWIAVVLPLVSGGSSAIIIGEIDTVVSLIGLANGSLQKRFDVDVASSGLRFWSSEVNNIFYPYHRSASSSNHSTDGWFSF